MPNHKTCRLGYASAKIRLIFSCRAFLLAGLACFCLAMPISRAAKDSKELIISNADFNSGKATLELLLQAKAAEQRGELQNAALLYQRAIEEALKGSGVLTVRDRDKIRRTECFVPVTDFCFEKLLGFGKDIREKYLVSYEHKAQRIFKKALATKNISMMIDLTQRYPLCEKSLEAHVFLADIAAESANYAAAARHYNIALKT